MLRVRLYLDYEKQQANGPVDRDKLAKRFGIKWGDVNKLIEAEQKYRDRLIKNSSKRAATKLLRARDKAATSDKTDKNCR